MKRSLFSIIALAFGLTAIPSGHAHAQLLLDQAVNGAFGGGAELGAAAHSSIDPATVLRNLQQQGYSNIVASPTDPLQYTATAPQGVPVTLTIEPRTGKILSALPQ
jgi:hypothetical protein